MGAAGAPSIAKFSPEIVRGPGVSRTPSSGSNGTLGREARAALYPSAGRTRTLSQVPPRLIPALRFDAVLEVQSLRLVSGAVLRWPDPFLDATGPPPDGTDRADAHSGEDQERDEGSHLIHDRTPRLGVVRRRSLLAMRPDELDRRLRARLDALDPAPRAELLHVVTLPDFEHVGAIQSHWGNRRPARSASC